ncbi:C-glycoside deglycosidase beta subunit domain-containing protein [Listeria costaricensis]|uniref:C-glycoside deglycosidase beta subunit domain-containing protein n=1 Tax=Listeria costaricensis TaxID=2026604 RepID=UPI000C07430E|nr:DUF6379 domain-containing protein [Listeria costaricensis]
MSFSMRINFVDVIVEGSLKNSYVNGHKTGYEFDIRLSYYRGLFLSCVDSFSLVVDGEVISNDRITLGLNHKEFFVDQLGDLNAEFWELLAPAKIKVMKQGGLAEGEHHIKLELFLRVPYLPVPGSEEDHQYVPLDSCGEKSLCIHEGRGE